MHVHSDSIFGCGMWSSPEYSRISTRLSMDISAEVPMPTVVLKPKDRASEASEIRGGGVSHITPKQDH